MTLTISRPRGFAPVPTPALPVRKPKAESRCTRESSRGGDASRLEDARRDALRVKVVEASRVLLCSGCRILGWYDPATPIASVIADLVRWCADPEHLPAKGWPFVAAWRWDVGESVTVWHSGRVLALVEKGADGRPVVTRFDVDRDRTAAPAE